ncbi:MAG: DNA polymerase III subunit delta, partial [Bacillota bacterium]
MQHKEILKQSLSSLDNLYLLIGSEDYLMKEFINQFLAEFLDQDFKDFNYDRFDDGEKNFISQLSSSINQLPFNAERRIVVVEGRRIFSNQFKKSEQKKMQRII